MIWKHNVLCQFVKTLAHLTQVGGRVIYIACERSLRRSVKCEHCLCFANTKLELKLGLLLLTAERKLNFRGFHVVESLLHGKICKSR